MFVAGTDRDLEEIDWSELKEESKTYWKNLGWGAYLKKFFTSLIVGLVPSSYDQVKDLLLSKQFFDGHYYRYNIQNPNEIDYYCKDNCKWVGKSMTGPGEEWKGVHYDQSVHIWCSKDCVEEDFDIIGGFGTEDDQHGSWANVSLLRYGLTNDDNNKYVEIECQPDCDWIYPHLHYLNDSQTYQDFDILRKDNQTTVTYHYSCFEQDIYWAWISLTIVFLPGIALFCRLISKEENRKSAQRVCITFLASLCFPLTVICAKVYKLFQFGEEWSRVAALLTQCEGQVEAFLQAGLQWYIIMLKPEKEASVFQWMTLIGSFAMIGLGQFKASFANRTPGDSKFKDIMKMALFTIVSFFMIGSFLFTAVIIAVLDKPLFYASYGIIASLPVIYLCLTRLKLSCLPQIDISNRKLKMIFLSIGCLIVTICCIIGLVLFNMDPARYYNPWYGYYKVPHFKTQSEGNIWLGIHSSLNLIYFICCLLFALISK